MYLLYADDSGNASDPDTKYSVLAGFAAYEDQPFWIEKAVDMERNSERKAKCDFKGLP